MNTVINPHLFRHRETASAAFNNLCTVVHRLAVEGTYAGQVVQGKRLLGTFRLKYDRRHEASQVDLDLSAFDALFRANTPHLADPGEMAVGGDGYVVCFASGHHTDLYLTLTLIQEQKGAPAFDSRKLGKGDMVAFRLWEPGSYVIENDLGGQRATLSVKRADDGKYLDPTKLEPARATLSDKGFDPSAMQKWPAQALVITIETTAALVLKATERAKAS